jgi:hypothetical protein
MPRHQTRTGDGTKPRAPASLWAATLMMIMVAAIIRTGGAVGLEGRSGGHLSPYDLSVLRVASARSASGYPATPKPAMMPAAPGDTYE